MRPTRHRQNPLKTPLNEVLGRESRVRVLRALTLSDQSLSTEDLARETKLDISGIKRVVSFLIRAGIIEYANDQSDRVRLDATYPLSEPLQSLFKNEHNHGEQVEGEIENALLRLPSPPMAAWISIPDTDDSTGKIDLGFLADRTVLDQSVHALRGMIAEIPIGYPTFVDVNGFTPEDLQALDIKARESLQAAKPLLGIHPLTILSARTAPRQMNTRVSHSVRDSEALELARLIAKKLTRDSSLLPRAKEIVGKRLMSASQREANELREWEQLLTTMSVSQLARFLTDSGERAVRLRQSLPFAGLVTEEERSRVRAKLKGK